MPGSTVGNMQGPETDQDTVTTKRVPRQRLVQGHFSSLKDVGPTATWVTQWQWVTQGGEGGPQNHQCTLALW
jgi:hypothetical protein